MKTNEIKMVKEIKCNGKGNILDLDNGVSYYQDEEGNIYRDKQEYLTETREKKINEILK
jgi:hypothetical protein